MHRKPWICWMKLQKVLHFCENLKSTLFPCSFILHCHSTLLQKSLLKTHNAWAGSILKKSFIWLVIRNWEKGKQKKGSRATNIKQNQYAGQYALNIICLETHNCGKEVVQQHQQKSDYEREVMCLNRSRETWVVLDLTLIILLERLESYCCIVSE